MGIFSKRAVPDRATPPMPRMSDIGDPEREWIAAHVELVTRTGTDVDDIGQLRSFYDRTAADWRRINPPERDDPNVIVNAIGMAFGEHLIHRTLLRWMIAEDERSTELALYEPRLGTPVYPANLVAERWLAEDSGEFLTTMAEDVASRFRGSGRRRRS